MFQSHNLDILVAGLIDSANNADDPGYVSCSIRDDQHVRPGMRGKVAVLRNQRAQYWYQLSRADVLDLQNLRNDIVTTRGALGTQRTCELPCRSVRDNFDDVARFQGYEAVHLQNREKRLVESFGRHGRRRQHRDLRVDARIDNEIFLGDLTDCLDDLPNIRFLVIWRDRRLLRPSQRRSDQGYENQCEKNAVPR